MDPKHLADKDQAFAGIDEMAELIGRYRAKLVDQGFSKAHAEQMCVDFNAVYWSQQPLAPQEGDHA